MARQHLTQRTLLSNPKFRITRMNWPRVKYAGVLLLKLLAANHSSTAAFVSSLNKFLWSLSSAFCGSQGYARYTLGAPMCKLHTPWPYARLAVWTPAALHQSPAARTCGGRS